MAEAYGHRFGQIIGDLLEDTVIRYCQPAASQYGMYLDYKHPRPARNNRKEVKWTDINGNAHKLDIVVEQDGSERKTGKPRAFIEVAWRRYTKHAKNKTQEITAAVKPIVSRYSESGPFYGAVLAGEFTETSLEQIKSEGFKLLFFSTGAIENAFASQGINAHWDEHTSEQELKARVDQLEALPKEQKRLIGDYLISNNMKQWKSFLRCLQNALERKIESVCVTSLFGLSRAFPSVQEACNHIAAGLNEITFTQEEFHSFEIIIKYSNGDRVDMQFKEQQAALASLERLI